MTDYMREIIYLKKIKKGAPASNDGFVRLNKKGNRLTICLAVKEKEAGFRRPVYLIYEEDGILKPYMAGNCGEEETTEITMETGQAGDMPEEICGILVGESSCYWSGACKKFSREIFYGQIDFPLDHSEAAGSAAESLQKENLQEGLPKKETDTAKAASLEDLPAQEPEKLQDPFLEKLSEMYPFEDDEMEWCLQMEPTDFTSFPMEFWHYARNSFLLHGFYNYRHLLYAHSKDKNYIGVPGQYHRREQYLANRFGFPRFKGTQKKRVTVGDFGYWLKEL